MDTAERTAVTARAISVGGIFSVVCGRRVDGVFCLAPVVSSRIRFAADPPTTVEPRGISRARSTIS